MKLNTDGTVSYSWADMKRLRERTLEEVKRAWPEMPAWSEADDGDTKLPEDEEIKAAFPTRSGRHDTYAKAMQLVGARRSKAGLVALVNWLCIEAGIK